VFVVDSSALVPHPPATVFAAAASLEGAVRWQSGVEGVRRPRGRSARTGPLVLLYRALGERHRLDVRVVAFDPPACFAYRADGGAFTLETTLQLEPTPGGTRVLQHVALDVAAGGATDPAALRRLIARRTAGDLARLAMWTAAWSRLVPPPRATVAR